MENWYLRTNDVYRAMAKKANEIRWGQQAQKVVEMAKAKRCETCGGEITWKGKLNETTVKKRRFCHTCVAQASKDRNAKKRLERMTDSRGYIKVWDGNRKRNEHDVIMEKLIDRPLARNEVVHHINSIRDDNRPENLQLMTRGEHSKYHIGANHPKKRKGV